MAHRAELRQSRWLGTVGLGCILEAHPTGSVAKLALGFREGRILTDKVEE